MKSKSYFFITGTLFLVVAFFHLMRILFSWPFQFGPVGVPLWASWLGFLFTLFLSLWGYGLFFKSAQEE